MTLRPSFRIKPCGYSCKNMLFTTVFSTGCRIGGKSRRPRPAAGHCAVSAAGAASCRALRTAYAPNLREAFVFSGIAPERVRCRAPQEALLRGLNHLPLLDTRLQPCWEELRGPHPR